MFAGRSKPARPFAPVGFERQAANPEQPVQEAACFRVQAPFGIMENTACLIAADRGVVGMAAKAVQMHGFMEIGIAARIHDFRLPPAILD